MSRNVHGTTILSVRKGKDVVMISDGRATGHYIYSNNNAKIYKLNRGRILVGISGSFGGCGYMMDNLLKHLKKHRNKLEPALVAQQREWIVDSDKRKLQAYMLIADKDKTYNVCYDACLVSDDGLDEAGSGGMYALAAAKALVMSNPRMGALETAKRAMYVAASMCPYTNDVFTIETL